jgi:hypothetical protein
MVVARTRKNPTAGEGAPRVRRPPAGQPELELSDEELRALADEGVDPDEVRRLAREPREADEVSEHDRETARDDVEGLALEQEQDTY